MELYFLRRSGIPVTFSKIKYKPESPTTIAKDNWVKDINIGAIQLRWIDSGLAPWNDVIQETWPAASTTADKRTKYKKAAKSIIDSSHPTRDVWDDSKYKFSNSFGEEVEDSTKAKKLQAKDLPDWDEFIKTDSKQKTVPGVRLSTHKDFTSNYSLAALDRQSHHTTQFLVAEYFNNNKPFHPFPSDRDWPATIVKSGQHVRSIKKATTGTSAVKVNDTFVGNRGGAMPAILLSAETHLGAGLHVTPKGDEKTPASQGYAIDSEFDSFMPAKMKKHVSADDHNRYVGAQNTNAAKEIYFAVQKTYRSIRNDMADKLTRNYPPSEVKYYARIADDQFAAKTANVKGGDENAKKTNMEKDLERIAGMVTQPRTGHNDKTLLPLGWDADDVS